MSDFLLFLPLAAPGRLPSSEKAASLTILIRSQQSLAAQSCRHPVIAAVQAFNPGAHPPPQHSFFRLRPTAASKLAPRQDHFGKIIVLAVKIGSRHPEDLRNPVRHFHGWSPSSYLSRRQPSWLAFRSTNSVETPLADSTSIAGCLIIPILQRLLLPRLGSTTLP